MIVLLIQSSLQDDRAYIQVGGLINLKISVKSRCTSFQLQPKSSRKHRIKMLFDICDCIFTAHALPKI